MNQYDINEINTVCPYEQGIFIEPFGIPNEIKEPVIYMRWRTGGIKGGSCWGTDHENINSEEKPKFKVLDMVLKKLKPDITLLEYREVEGLIQSSEKTEFEYYGNRNEYSIEFIVLSDLEKFIAKTK